MNVSLWCLRCSAAPGGSGGLDWQQQQQQQQQKQQQQQQQQKLLEKCSKTEDGGRNAIKSVQVHNCIMCFIDKYIFFFQIINPHFLPLPRDIYGPNRVSEYYLKNSLLFQHYNIDEDEDEDKDKDED
jgi:hypothetical protein